MGKKSEKAQAQVTKSVRPPTGYGTEYGTTESATGSTEIAESTGATYNKKGQLNHVYYMLLHPRLELLVLMVKSNQLVHSLVPPTGVVAFPSDALGAFASST
jgi:hypothetical protein|uniref:Uncharacterized protein n=1 Tax=Picea glauca TaxID=3330 RepID=A0A101M1R0_PICGL|nr:hypothetical protein ABT39_MTgene3851 [Picea glauca]QHR86118.1 hypothetical protein Q903MT_gene117 [Picea sitchensis]